MSKTLHKACSRIERFSNRIKHARCIVTRYEEHAANYFTVLKITAIQVWLRC